MIRKYNQIDHYVELVAPMFEQDDSDEIVLLDCACGKSYLSFVMNYYIHEYCIAAAVSSAWTSRSTLLTRAVQWPSVSAITI